MIKWALVAAFTATALLGRAAPIGAQTASAAPKTRLAVIGLDHDHVWSLLKDIAGEPSAELIAIAEPDPALVKQAQKEVPARREILRGVRGHAGRGEARSGDCDHVERPAPGDFAAMREAARSLLDGKTDGYERQGRAGDGTAGARSKYQVDGELLE